MPHIKVKDSGAQDPYSAKKKLEQEIDKKRENKYTEIR